MIWVAALPELLVTTAGYAYLFWGPILFRDALHLSNLANRSARRRRGDCRARSAMLLTGASSDRTGDRVIHCGGVCVRRRLRGVVRRVRSDARWKGDRRFGHADRRDQFPGAVLGAADDAA